MNSLATLIEEGAVLGPKGDIGTIDNLKAPEFLVAFVGGKWCPNTVKFIPELLKFYSQVNEKEKKLEVLYLSVDAKESEYRELIDSFPWFSIPFGNNINIRKFLQDNEITICPSVLVINKQDWRVVWKNGRGDIIKNPQEALNIWSNKLNELAL